MPDGGLSGRVGGAINTRGGAACRLLTRQCRAGLLRYRCVRAAAGRFLHPDPPGAKIILALSDRLPPGPLLSPGTKRTVRHAKPRRRVGAVCAVGRLLISWVVDPVFNGEDGEE